MLLAWSVWFGVRSAVAITEASQLLCLTKPKVYFSFTPLLGRVSCRDRGRRDVFPYGKLRITSVAEHIFPVTSRSKTSVANRGRGGGGWK